MSDAPEAGGFPMPAGATRLRWHALVASTRGATHERLGMPLQDAALVAGDPSGSDGVFVVAVADGHGNPRHFRSARGAQLAVDVASEEGFRFGERMAASPGRDEVASMTRDELVPALNDRWRRAVERDIASDPLDARGGQDADPGDLLTPYGTTLLCAIAAFPWLVLCQIGDGDIVTVDADGVADTPVPGDPRLDGQHTTSLCQRDAVSSFRHAVMDLRSRTPAVVLVATDGFGNAQAVDPWHEQVGRDLVDFARQHGIDWMREHLPSWAERCASADGSGDDTSVVILLRDVPDVTRSAPGSRGVEEAVAVSGVTATGPSARRRRMTRLLALVAGMAIVAVIVLLVLGSASGPHQLHKSPSDQGGGNSPPVRNPNATTTTTTTTTTAITATTVPRRPKVPRIKPPTGLTTPTKLHLGAGRP